MRLQLILRNSDRLLIGCVAEQTTIANPTTTDTTITIASGPVNIEITMEKLKAAKQAIGFESGANLLDVP